jgi:hypothetical protein
VYSVRKCEIRCRGRDIRVDMGLPVMSRGRRRRDVLRMTYLEGRSRDTSSWSERAKGGTASQNGSEAAGSEVRSGPVGG